VTTQKQGITAVCFESPVKSKYIWRLEIIPRILSQIITPKGTQQYWRLDFGLLQTCSAVCSVLRGLILRHPHAATWLADLRNKNWQEECD